LNLLVGATGFVGGHLVEYLFEQGEISKGLFRKGAHLKILDTNGVQGIEGDVLDHHSLHDGMEGVDTVYNLASPTPGEDIEFEKANTEGVLNLIEVAKEEKVKNLIHLSTVDVFGFTNSGRAPSEPNPSNPYQKAKAEAERLLLEQSKRSPSPRIVIIRAAKAVGSRDPSFVTPVLRMAKEGKVTLPDSGVMSFVHPKDVAQAMLKAATGAAPSGTMYTVKSFDATPLALAKELVSATGLPAEVKKQGLFAGGSLAEYTSKQLRAARVIDAQANWSQLGYAPVFDVKLTSSEVAKWYKKDPWAIDA